MDQAEAIIEEYLKQSGCSPVHHPDGESNPPDFLIDGDIGIEVRRLTQHWKDGDRYRGTDERTQPFTTLVESVLAEFGPTTDGVTYWVTCRFHNPVPEARSFRKALKIALNEWLADPNATNEMEIGTVKLTVSVGPSHEDLFQLAMRTNRDTGGFVVAEIINNVNICIAEKTSKVQRVLHLHSEWWLALVDFTLLGDGMGENDIQVVRDNIQIPSCWSKVLLLVRPTTVWQLKLWQNTRGP